MIFPFGVAQGSVRVAMKGGIGAIVAVTSLIFAWPGATQAPPSPSSPSDPGEIVVQGYPPHCHPRPGDPQDTVDLAPAAAHRQQQVIRIDPATGRYGLFPDDYPMTGLRDWQRDGTGIHQFVFRAPTNDDPVCIGAATSRPRGFAQLRRSFPARPYWGKVMRFTGFIATRKAAYVQLWAAGGAGGYRPGRQVRGGSNIVVGGGQRSPFTGDRKWTPVSLTIGPIPCMATQISYGVTLAGGGDVWLHRAAFAEVPDGQLAPAVSRRDRGAAYLQKDPICRHFLRGETLFVGQKKERAMVISKLTNDDDIVPGMVLFMKDDPDAPGSDRLKQSGQTFVRVPYERYFAMGLSN